MPTHTSKIKAIAASKCPKCRVGHMFVGSPYGMKKQRMNDICPHCGFRFEIEPGYFYAAMYVSYGLSMAQLVIVGLLTYEFTKSESPWVYLAVLLVAIAVSAPFNYRYSRLILLHYLTPKVKYDPKYEDELAKTDS
ncbi:DUF983 domain-containing protein [Parapedobacter sp. 2B3]|uniref:DUF983 domain-containing protein n=1 Tax=Parapedobacter sp. 2B3 TaxID=3342381 RepID=UPI0035B62307